VTSPRRSRRAVRPAGTVGTTDDVLLTTVPAHDEPTSAAATTPRAAPAGSAPPAALGDDAEHPAVATRSRDDSDVGWGDRPDDDDRITRERPPHW